MTLSDQNIGVMKASPDGKFLCQTNYADYTGNFFQLFDFDNATGVASNPNVSPANYVYAYGIEWSPGGTKIYGGMENSNDLWQFDVSAGANVWNTATLIYETTSQEYEALQLGPDHKIYTSRYQTAWLGVVNDPDSAGAACNYVDDGVNLLGRVCYLGLPNYNMSIFNSQVFPAFSSPNPNLCQKFCTSFTDESTNNPTAWLWSFPGGTPSSSTDQNPANVCYQTAGTYDVTLITTNASGNDTTTMPNFITVYATPPFPVITQVNYTLTSSAAFSYQWQLNAVDISGATNQSYNVMQTGLYTVIVGDTAGCVNSSNKFVLITGIEGVNGAGTISISPNPSNGNFTIELQNATGADDVVIDVVNLLGQKVYSTTDYRSTGPVALKKQIHLGDIPTGVYFIEVKAGNSSAREKMVIAR